MPEDNDLVSTNGQEPPQSKEEMPSGQDQVPAVPSVQVREPTIIELPSSYEPGPQPQDTDDQHQQKLVPQVEQVHTDTEPELLQPDQEVEQPEQQVGEVFVQPEPEAEQQVDEVVVQPEPQVDEVFIEPEPQVDEIFIEPEPQVDEVFIEPEPQMDEKFIEQEPQMDEVFIEPEPQVDELFVEPELQVDGVFIEPEPQMDEVFVEPEPQMDEEFIEQEPQMDEVFIEPEPQVDELFVEPEPQVDGVFIEPEPQMDEVFIEPGTQVDEVFIEPEIDEVFIEPEMDNVYIATEGDDRQEVPDPDDDLEFVVDNIAEDYEEVEPQENPATFDKAGDFLSWFIPYLKPEEEVHVSSEEILSDEPNPDTDVMILSLYEADTDQTPPGVTLIDETAAVKEDSYPIDHDDGLGEEMILSDFELLGEQALPVNEESTVMEGHPMLKDSPIMAVAFDISHPYGRLLQMNLTYQPKTLRQSLLFQRRNLLKKAMFPRVTLLMNRFQL
ncbi:cytadherence high molecular weight protein 3-like [Homarus americanus]|uniref:cytadherence high molecular weight protein 3-like n=1 Tax=Homarus americanus TaxID=6706 RepID=UPI001C44A4CD|nr:cytadherence high molecular weight protein 3-like [Homarus americanus]